MNSLLEDIERKKAIIVVGSGGVGKTTISSAIAIKASETGKKTLVMTVDPARRLADSLGISGKLTREPVKVHSNLFAFMVELRESADRLVDRFAPSKEIAEKIKNHRFYRQATDFLMGSHEYVAAQFLYDFYSKKNFDLIVLDTPPARHALEFFEAPSKVMDFLRSKVISRFLKAYLVIGKRGYGLMKRFGGIFSLIEKLTGVDLLMEISEFILFFEGMYDRFFREAEELFSFLRSEEVAFYLVTSPERERIFEVAEIRERLREMGIKRCGLIINRVSPFLFTEWKNGGIRLSYKVERYMNEMIQAAESQKKVIENLAKKYRDVLVVPELHYEVHSLEKLREMLPYLLR